MSHMFCTLQEAARTLNTSEDQIEALLASGLLQEFREGQHCLLKEADVGALAQRQRQRRGAGAGARPPQSPGPQDRRGVERRRSEATGPHQADRRPANRVSLGQWFWMGLVQDRPVAIALLSGLVLALVAALVAGLCFLTQAS